MFYKMTAYHMRIIDWSSDVCSADLAARVGTDNRAGGGARPIPDPLPRAARRGKMSSNKPIVIVTRKLPETTEARMKELFDTRLSDDDAPMDDEALVAAMQQADVLVPTVTDHITAPLIGRAGERPRPLANYGHGVDNIALRAAREQIGRPSCRERVWQYV